jgi:hypothetical protein
VPEVAEYLIVDLVVVALADEHKNLDDEEGEMAFHLLRAESVVGVDIVVLDFDHAALALVYQIDEVAEVDELKCSHFR